jgi:hypothetical protein
MSCAQTYLSLRGFSESMSAVEITDVLGVNPTEVRVTGEPAPGTMPAAKDHLWLLATKDHVSSLRVSDHVRWLQETLEGHTLPRKEAT